MLVTIGIVILIAAVSGPALDSERNRANLDSAVQQFRDLISQTQAYALAPESPDAQHYLLAINYGLNQQTFYGPTLLKNEYGIYVVKNNWGTITNIKKGKVAALSSISINSSSTGYIDPNQLFKIHFRTTDGIAGCSRVYYETWGTTCSFATNSYAEISIGLGSQTKIIKVNKITGETEVITP